jgi:hypothetical protein
LPNKVKQGSHLVLHADLVLLLKAHALQASQLADQVAKQESAMIQFIGASESCVPDKCLSLLKRMESVRRSATEDLRLAVRTLEELKYPPVAMGAVLNAEQRAVYVTGSSKIFGHQPNQEEGK